MTCCHAAHPNSALSKLRSRHSLDAPSRKRASLCIPTNAQSAASSIPPLSQIPRSRPQAGWRASFDRWRNSREQAPPCEAMGHGRRCQAESTGRQRSVCSTCRSSAPPARYVSQKEAYDWGIQLPGVRKKGRSARQGCYRGSATTITRCGSFWVRSGPSIRWRWAMHVQTKRRCRGMLSFSLRPFLSQSCSIRPPSSPVTLRSMRALPKPRVCGST
ncbi:hypothetical protein SAMN03159423_5533 [Bradyrhizobium sp. NFR13]|nr:hypothetical protein SAMN03159423_5533 [Bradyrhizobium sp. NFR13]